MSTASATTAPSLDAAEFEARHERAQAVMREAGMDALLVTEKYNYWYFSGHLSNEFDKRGRPMLLLIPATGRPVALVYGLTARVLTQRCPNIECRSYEDVPFELSSLVELIDDLRLAGARIGMELGGDQRLGLSYQDVAALSAALPDAKLVDAGPVVTALRAVKSAAEVEAIRHACRLSERAWVQTLEAVHPGKKVAGIRAELGAALCRAGCDVNIAGHVDVRLNAPGRTVADRKAHV